VLFANGSKLKMTRNDCPVAYVSLPGTRHASLSFEYDLNISCLFRRYVINKSLLNDNQMTFHLYVSRHAVYDFVVLRCLHLQLRLTPKALVMLLVSITVRTPILSRYWSTVL